MAIQVKNNSFYRRVPISTSGAVKLLSQFKDLPTAEASTLTLKGAAGANRIVFSGSTPPDPPFGGGKLVGGFLTITPSSTDLTKTGKLPQVALYKAKEGTQIKEGGMHLGTSGSGGDSLFVTTTTFDENIPILEENFDGAGKSLGSVPTVGTHGGGRNLFSDEYLWPEEAAEKVHAGGDYSMFHIGEDPEESGGQFMRRYFGRNISDTTDGKGAMSNRVIFVRPRNRKKPHGFWTNKYDNRTGLNKYTVFAPIWKYNDIKGNINFVKSNPSSDTEPPELTKNNTIFEFLGKSPTNETLSTMDPDSSTPWSQTFLQLSNEVSAEGGTSLEMSHIWSWTSSAPNSNVVYGDTKSINPQFTVIGGPIIPYPIALDNALALGVPYDSSGAVDKRPVETAILSANFSPKPISTDIITNNATFASATKFLYVSYYDSATKRVGGFTSGSAWSASDTVFLFDTNGIARDTSTSVTIGAIASDASGRIGDTGGGSNAVAPFVNMKINVSKMDGTIFASGAASGDYAIKAKKFVDATDSGSNFGGTDQYITGTTNPMRTFLRSFVVTLSNYEALSGETMDRYVARGLDDAYLSGDRLFTDKKNIGGIAFQRFIDDSEDHENSYIVASPLATRKSLYAYSNADADGLYQLVGSKGYRGSYTEAGTSIDADARILCEGALLDPTVTTAGKSVTNLRAATTNNYEPCVKLQMNEFFDLRFVFSLQGAEIGSGATADPATNNNKSAIVRAYLSQGETDETAIGNPLIPSLPVYFPCSGGYDSNGNAVGAAGYSASNNVIRPYSTYATADGEAGYPAARDTTNAVQMFPKYMYIWCQNYRYIDKTATGSNAKNTDGFWGLGSSSQTILYDTATEKAGERGVTVHVDSVTLNNFNSQTENNSAGSGILSRPITIRESTITGYMGCNYTTTNSGTLLDYNSSLTDNISSYSNMNVGGFSQFPDARGIELPKRYMPAYISIGFENGIGDLYATGARTGYGNDYTGWLLWSGFASDNFSKLSRQDMHSTNLWYSSGFNLQTSGTQSSKYIQQRGKDLFSDYSRGTGTSEGRNDSGKLPSYVTKGNIPADSTPVAPLSLLQYTGSANTVLSTDGFTQKGAMRINVCNGAQTTVDGAQGTNPSTLVLDDASLFPDAKGTIVITYADGNKREGDYNGKSSNTLNNVSLTATFANIDRDVSAGTVADGLVVNYAAPQDNMVYGWAKRENSLCAAKIIAAPKYDDDSALSSYNGGVLQVDDPHIFDEATLGDTEYIAYRADGGAMTDPFYLTGGTGEFVDAQGLYVQGLRQLRKRDGDVIFFDMPLDSVRADFKVGNPWYICPRKYWINLALYPGDGTLFADGEPDSFASQSGFVFAGTGFKGNAAVQAAGTYVMNAQARNTSKYYDTIALLSGTVAPAAANTGSTWNEWTYNWNATEAANALVGTSSKAGVYGKSWILDKAEKSETNLDLTKDYGFGAFDEDTGEGGEVDIQTVYSGYQTPFDISQVVKKNNSGPSEDFVTTINLFSPTADQSATLYGNDYNTAADEPDWHLIKPHYLFRYHDELPMINNMQVGPAFNVLDKETNLYELQNENLSGINFTWEESGDDVWYRMLFVNDAPISNKYCNAELWMPLNESGNSGACPVYNFYKPTDGFSSGSLTSGAHGRADPIGLQGYGFRATKYATGGDGFLQFPHASGAAMTSSTDYLFLLHTTPMLTSASGGSLYSKGTASSDGFEVSINAAGNVVVQQRGVSLTGTTQLDRDNDVNYQIAVRYQQTGVKKFALYVNGKEEAYNGTAPSAVNSTAVTYIGSGSVGRYEGIIEEIVYYEIDKTKNDVQFVETSGEYIYNNPYLLDKTGTGAADTTYTHYGRIALFDYHNVRGRGRTQVAMSNTTAWRGTAL